MEKVRKMIRAGASIPTAIKESLGMPVAEFADKYGVARPMVSAHINGSVRPTEKTVNGLIAELGGTTEEWERLLWEAGKPEVTNGSAA